ncbi:MAG: peptide chain release factor N(5)-glutamine methyltransferase [Pseudomonadota bacterium]
MIDAFASLGEALFLGRTRLQSSGSPTAYLDARVLLEHVTGLQRDALIAGEFAYIGEEWAEAYAAALTRREAGEPVAYITRRQEFWDHPFEVGPGVLIPRPETEMLVDETLRLDPPPREILDLGTGSGALLLSVLVALPQARGVGIDASQAALDEARRNRHRLKVGDRAELLLLDFSEASQRLSPAKFDVILANPPYIRDDAKLPPSVADYEPAMALFAGESGLDALVQCAEIIADLLKPQGSAFVEIGHDQRAEAKALFEAAMPEASVSVHTDAAGHPRMVAIRPKRGL